MAVEGRHEGLGMGRLGHDGAGRGRQVGAFAEEARAVAGEDQEGDAHPVQELRHRPGEVPGEVEVQHGRVQALRLLRGEAERRRERLGRADDGRPVLREHVLDVEGDEGLVLDHEDAPPGEQIPPPARLEGVVVLGRGWPHAFFPPDGAERGQDNRVARGPKGGWPVAELRQGPSGGTGADLDSGAGQNGQSSRNFSCMNSFWPGTLDQE
jgi:hypothetical protein